jgi:alpha-glucosidase
LDLLKRLVRAWRMIGPGNIVRAWVYARAKAAHERAGSGRAEPRPAWEEPGALLEVRVAQRRAVYTFERRTLVVSAPWPDVVALDWSPSEASPAPPPRDGPGAPFTADQEAFRTQALELRFGAGSLALHAAGRRLRLERLPRFRGARSRHEVHLEPDESIHGLGERAANFDLRAGRYPMWNTGTSEAGSYGPGADPLYACIPVYLAHRAGGSAYAAFYANPARAVFDIGVSARDEFAHEFDGGPLRYYLIAGPAERALARLLDLTGRPPLPPLWALGFHQSRWSYHPEARVRNLVDEFERHRVPVSAVHLDIEHMRGHRVFTVDQRKFPDLAGLCGDLLQRGVRIVTIVDPGVKRDPSYPLYAAGARRQVFVGDRTGRVLHAPVWPGWAAFPDFTSSAARSWWGGEYRSLVEMGVSGFWHDMNEPQAFTASGEGTLPANARHETGPHELVHNLYAVLMNQAGFEGLERARPERRPFIVSRSGWAGLQRHAFLWTGDVESSWDALAQSVRTLLGLAVSGVPFAGSDAGGFTGDPDPELYLRWLQLAAFTPFFRVHSARGSPPREPWAHREPWLARARETIQFRYRLLPYLYTLAHQAATAGLPPLRPMLLAHATLAGVEDAFLLGDALIVAPVLAPGQRRREVSLPPGAWYDFWTGARFEGPGRVTLEAPLERVPLLVAAGRVIPLAEGGLLDRDTCDLALRAFPPAEGEEVESTLYTDAGEGFGQSRVDKFLLATRGRTLKFDWKATGEYPWPYRNTVLEVMESPTAGRGEDRGPPRRQVLNGPGTSIEVELP